MNPFAQEMSEARPVNRLEDNNFFKFVPNLVETPVQNKVLDQRGVHGMKTSEQSFLYKKLSPDGKLDTLNTLLIGAFSVIGLYMVYQLTAAKTLKDSGLFALRKK